ncbi:putative thioredoxin-like ferredoxin [Helianthus annuus]|nr:putative thioredoxin-like ferredoxin [Helianthus annuus]
MVYNNACFKLFQPWFFKTFHMLEKDDFPLPKVLAGALKAPKNDIHVKTLLTICEGREGTELSDGDVLLFPEMIKYR